MVDIAYVGNNANGVDVTDVRDKLNEVIDALNSGGGGGLTVEDGTVTVDPTTVLRLINGLVGTLTDFGGGVAELDLQKIADLASGGVTDGDRGDIIVSIGGTVWTINDGVVTLTKMADLAANSLIGNNTGAVATPLALSPTQVKALLSIAAADVSGLGTLAEQDGTFSGTSSGTNTGDQTSIVGITGSIAEFNAACTDADFLTDDGSGGLTLTGEVVASAFTVPGGPSMDATGYFFPDGTFAASAGFRDTATVVLPNGRGVLEWSETIAAVGVLPANLVSVSLGATTNEDENEPEGLQIASLQGIAGTDEVTLNLAFLSPVSGPVKLNWSAQ